MPVHKESRMGGRGKCKPCGMVVNNVAYHREHACSAKTNYMKDHESEDTQPTLSECPCEKFEDLGLDVGICKKSETCKRNEHTTGVRTKDSFQHIATTKVVHNVRRENRRAASKKPAIYHTP